MSRVHPIIAQLTIQRRGAGMTQGAFARRMGSAQSAVSEIESGKTSPTLATLTRMAAVLGLDVVLAAQPTTEEETTNG